MNCYLCDQALRFAPSWRGIFLFELPDVLCVKCRSAFSKLPSNGCRLCGKEGSALCTDCSYWEMHGFEGLIHSGKSLYRYNEAMKAWVHQYKFLKDGVLAEVFAQDIRNALGKEQAAIVPVPLHPEKLASRSFSQVDQLLNSAGLPYRHLLHKTGGTMGEKSREERLAVMDLFVHNGEAVPKDVLVVDDLYTTGATMRQAAKVLQQAGAEKIRIFSLIRA